MKKAIVTTNPKKTEPAAAQPFELVGPGPTTPRILKTSDLPGGTRSTEIDDKNFIGINATAAELAALRKQIEDRQRPPAPAAPGEHTETILVCDNPKCRAWFAYEPKHVPRALGSCIFCNHRNLKDGGQMRLATPAETTLFWSERRRLAEISRLRMKQQQEAELERRQLGIHLHLDNKQGPSVQDDPTIKRNR